MKSEPTITNLSRKETVRPLRARNRKLDRLKISLLICLLCFSCHNPALYDRYQSIEDDTWKKDRVYYFTFRIEDISTPYDLILEVRNDNLYPYRNLWLFCTEEAPVGLLKRDTIECMLADEFGKWHGKGISLYQNSFPIRSAYYFPHAGQYTFGFRQGMRNDRLKGIREIGFRIEHSTLPPGSIQPEKDK